MRNASPISRHYYVALRQHERTPENKVKLPQECNTVPNGTLTDQPARLIAF
jgi:hypothetical protein